MSRKYSNIERRFTERARQLRKRSKRQGIPCDISGAYLAELYHKQEAKCFYSDHPLNVLDTTLPRRLRTSIDKVYPEMGYTTGNVVLCIDRINTMKYDATLEEMKEWMPGWYQRLVNGGFVKGEQQS